MYFATSIKASRGLFALPGATPASVKSCILHVDMDCFFVSVGIRHRPELRGEALKKSTPESDYDFDKVAERNSE